MIYIQLYRKRAHRRVHLHLWGSVHPCYFEHAQKVFKQYSSIQLYRIIAVQEHANGYNDSLMTNLEWHETAFYRARIQNSSN